MNCKQCNNIMLSMTYPKGVQENEYLYNAYLCTRCNLICKQSVHGGLIVWIDTDNNVSISDVKK